MKRKHFFFFAFLFLVSCNSHNTKINESTNCLNSNNYSLKSEPASTKRYNDIVKSFQNFTYKWINDSYGLTDFRKSSYCWDSSIDCYRINGVNLKGFPLEVLLKLLGPPDVRGIDPESQTVVISYNLGCFKTYDTCALEFYFNKENELENILAVTEMGK